MRWVSNSGGAAIILSPGQPSNVLNLSYSDLGIKAKSSRVLLSANILGDSGCPVNVSVGIGNGVGQIRVGVVKGSIDSSPAFGLRATGGNVTVLVPREVLQVTLKKLQMVAFGVCRHKNGDERSRNLLVTVCEAVRGRTECELGVSTAAVVPYVVEHKRTALISVSTISASTAFTGRVRTAEDVPVALS